MYKNKCNKNVYGKINQINYDGKRHACTFWNVDVSLACVHF